MNPSFPLQLQAALQEFKHKVEVLGWGTPQKSVISPCPNYTNEELCFGAILKHPQPKRQSDKSHRAHTVQKAPRKVGPMLSPSMAIGQPFGSVTCGAS